MKLPIKIEIDVLDFLKRAKFDCIKLGQSKELILNNFPDPDNFCDAFMGSRINIWNYGDIEFHFDKANSLFLIYSDYLEELDAGEYLQVNKWILNDYSKLCLKNVLTELNKEGIDYCKSTQNLSVILKLKSGVELGFKGIEADQNKLHINYFSLVRSDLKL